MVVASYPHVAPETVEQIRRETVLELLSRVDEEAHRLYAQGDFVRWLQAREMSSAIFAEALRQC